mmetsp:Transcript_30520/g.98642  ORF Transcript_30520/g.98642 Transcript_30520/m.98642 type:complete len:253 (-) Transcript_30520:60-818(-)
MQQRRHEPKVERETEHLPPRGPVELRGVGAGQNAVGEEDNAHVGEPRHRRHRTHRLGDDLRGNAQEEERGRAGLQYGGLRHVEPGDEEAVAIGLVHGAATSEGQGLAVVLHVPLHAYGVTPVGNVVDYELECGRQRIRHADQMEAQRIFAGKGVGVLGVIVDAILGELRTRLVHRATIPGVKVPTDCCGGGALCRLRRCAGSLASPRVEVPTNCHHGGALFRLRRRAGSSACAHARTHGRRDGGATEHWRAR